MTQEEAKARLFVGVYPTGLVYCDRKVEQHGDYKKLAYLNFWSLDLETYGRIHPELLRLILADAEAMQAKRGQWYETSTSGQGLILGTGPN